MSLRLLELSREKQWVRPRCSLGGLRPWVEWRRPPEEAVPPPRGQAWSGRWRGEESCGGGHVRSLEAGEGTLRTSTRGPFRKRWDRSQQLAEVPLRGLEFIPRMRGSFWKGLTKGVTCPGFYLEFLLF